MLVDDVRLTPLPSCNSRLTACFVSLRDAMEDATVDADELMLCL